MSVRGAGESSAPAASHRELFSQMTAPAPRYVLVSTAGDAGSQGQHAVGDDEAVWSMCGPQHPAEGCSTRACFAEKPRHAQSRAAG